MNVDISSLVEGTHFGMGVKTSLCLFHLLCEVMGICLLEFALLSSLFLFCYFNERMVGPFVVHYDLGDLGGIGAESDSVLDNHIGFHIGSSGDGVFNGDTAMV